MSRPGLRLATLLTSVLCLAALPAVPPVSPVHFTAVPAASGGWLDRFNTWRANAGVQLLTENTTWSAGDYAHALYMVKNDLVTHYETPGTPYYTVDGDTAAKNSNIYISSSTSTSDNQAIDWWMQAPFHAMGMMDPRLAQTGFGSYREVKPGWDMGAAVDVVRGNSFGAAQYPVYFPGNGTTEPLTTYGGGEWPDPLQACPGYGAPTGLPVFVQVGGNVSTVAGPSHSFTGNGVPLAHCVIDSTNAAVGSWLVSRGGVILIPQQPLQVGVKYAVSLTVNGAPYTWSFTVGPFNACVSVAVATSAPSPAVAGGGVALTATASGCPNPNPLYKFWVLAPGATSYQLGQDYSATPTFNWNTSGLAPGAYHFSVWVRDANSAGVYGNSFGRWDAYNNATAFTLTAGACGAVNASASPVSPAGAGTRVTVTAQAIGCPDANPVYQFWLLPPGGSAYQVGQAYSTSSTFNWTTTGLAPGTYRFSIWARDANSTGAFGNTAGRWDAYNNDTLYTLTPTGCTAVSVSALPASPAAIGTSVTLQASPSGCPDPNPQYEFLVLAPGSSAYQVAQAYSTTQTLVWNTASLTPGTYRFSVWIRDANSSGIYGNSVGRWDAYDNSTLYTLTATCSGVSASASPASGAGVGTVVSVTAHAAGCASPLYRLLVLAPGATSYQLGQDYSSNPTFNWNTAGLTPGTYRISVWVRDANSSGIFGNSSGRWDAYDNNTLYALTPGCSAVSVYASPPSPSAPGALVSLTAHAAGCPNPVYEFWILVPGASSYRLAQAYSSNATLQWNTSGAPAGTYVISVWARDASSSGAYGNSFGRWDAYNNDTLYVIS